MNSAEEEDVTIEDVVDCRIILVRQVGEPPERPPPNNSNAPKVEFSFVDLTGDDSEEEIDSDLNNEDDVMGEKKECQTLGVKAATCSIPAPTISSLIATSNHCGESCDNDADGAGTQNLIERGELVSEAEAEDCDAKLDSAAATITPENGSANDVLLSEGAGVPNCRQEEGIQSDTNNRRCAQHGLNKDDKRKTTQRGITTDIKHAGGIERRINLDDKEVDADDRKDSDSRQSLDPSNGKNTLACQNGSTGTRTDASNEHHIGVCESVQIGSTNQIPQEKCGLERAHATESTISMSSGSAEHGSAKMPIDDSGMIVEDTAYTQIANSHEAREVADCSSAVDDAMKENTMVSDHGPAVCSKEDIKVDMDHVTHDSSNDIIEIIDESDSEIDEANVEDDDDSDDDFESENGKDKSNDKSNYPTKEHSTTEGNGKAACDAPSHKEAEPCIEILDDSDDNEIEIVGVSIPEKIKLGRKRKLEEMKKAEAVNFILERSMRQAKMKQTKMTTEKTMYVNKRRRQDSSSQPNFTFYDGNKKNHTSTNNSKTNKETHWRFKYNYNEEAALEEQERLLRESVARVKAQGGIERLLQISTPKASGGQLYTQPVKDVSTLPNNHFKWKDPYSRLGVPRKSRYEIVKRNYRKLCLLYHPDKSHYKESQDRFQAIKEAYEEIKESLGL